MDIKNLKINEDWLYHRVDAIKLGKIIKSDGLKARKHLSKEDRKQAKNGVWNGKHYISFAKKAEGKDTAYDHYIKGEFALIFDPDIGAIKTKVKEVGSIFEMIAKLPTNKRFSRWKEEYQVKKFVPFGKVVGIKIPNGKRMWDFNYSGDYQKDQLRDILKVLDETDSNIPFIDVEEGRIVSKEEMTDAYIDKKREKEKKESNKSK